MPKILALYLDAFSCSDAKLLFKELPLKVSYLRLVPVLGYTDCFKVTLLTGLPPKKHGFWVSYRFTMNRYSKCISFIDYIDYLPFALNKGLRFIITRLAYPVHCVPAHVLPYVIHSDIQPESDFYLIDSVLRSSNYYTLFEFFNDRGLTYAVYEDRQFRHDLSKLMKVVSASKEDFVLLYIDELDFWGHRFGVRSMLYRRSLLWLCDFVKSLLSRAIDRGYTFIVFSDHGMANVHSYVNVMPSLLRDSNLGETYVVGVDATMIRFKYLSDEGVRHSMWLREFIKPFARKLSPADYDRYSLPLDPGYGDEVWLLNEGYCFYPNYFSWLKPRGMHAYDPLLPSQHGVVLAPRSLLEDHDKDIIYVPELHNILIKSVMG